MENKSANAAHLATQMEELMSVSSGATGGAERTDSKGRARFRRNPEKPRLHPSETNICFDHSNAFCARGDSCRFVHDGELSEKREESS